MVILVPFGAWFSITTLFSDQLSQWIKELSLKTTKMASKNKMIPKAIIP